MRRSTALFVTLMILLLVLVTVALGWRVQVEKRQFIEHQHFIMRKQAEITAKDIEARVNALRDSMIAISLDDLWLRELETFHSIDELQKSLFERFKLYFPSMIGFGIADEHGEILWSNLDFFVSDVCRQDLEKSAEILSLQTQYYDYKTYLHPQPGNYHFDMIFPVLWNQKKLVFFMSFSPKPLSEALRESQISQHEVYLLRSDRQGLIEVTTEGTRETLSRPYFLQEDELRRVAAKVAVSNTLWEVAVVENPLILKRFAQHLIWHAAVVWGVFVVLWLGLLWFAMHHEKHQGHLFKRLNHLSMHDELTGLANRRMLIQGAGEALKNLQNEGIQSGLMYLDLDDFKPVNDRYGHDMGDKLLQAFAIRLQKYTRIDDLVARLGGDEFVIMFQGLATPPESAVAQLRDMTERYQSLLNEPYEIDGKQIVCHISIGWILLLPQMEGADEILRQADKAMYQQKKRNKQAREQI
ncbi:GGDEF domain-containing protein [Thiomicrorhabdus xiamenensis]|uniref:GGDEF domain-containing protein n=1 Tax=Thiomicrorhabdus xiamenensis TaxID=2739063 RepID=A0A7D4SIX9_9GAMM|nr:GGDEF domain-containing protein [Thiomicrorhabdus xiamenensis]QKI90200.1 GGDEF domain-containing protein [Thiomicrorhabdus xiamenensis]